jgi:hypothetical protein
MNFGSFAVASLALFGAASARADAASVEAEDETEILLGDLTCADFKALIAEAESRPYEPPPPPSPECAAVCVAAQLATCSINPRACGGNATIPLGDYDDICFCERLNQTPAEPAPR